MRWALGMPGCHGGLPFQVSWYVYQKFKWDGLWSELASEEERAGGSVGERGEGGGRGIWDKNKQRLIVHKSSRSIVSGEPPAALAHVVPMKRSKHAPVGPTRWEAACSIQHM